MKKVLFAMIVCCLAVSTTFAQFNKDVQLNEDKLSREEPFEIDGYVQGCFVIKIVDEPDDQGCTPVQIELKHSSNDYEFLLFDHDWPKKELRKQCVVLDRNFVGENSKSVQSVELLNKDCINEVELYGSYTFPEIRIPEGKKYECKIPIHLAKAKFGLFCPNKKKVYNILYCIINISVDNRDKVYEKLESECFSLLDSLKEALDRGEFCTNSRHKIPFDEQTKDYTEAKEDLVDSISSYLNDKGWPKKSKKYERYKALLDSLDKMDVALEQYEHDCGEHRPKKQINCDYCDLNFEEIDNNLVSIYIDLHNNYEKKTAAEKAAIKKKTEALYKCCKSHPKHSKQWNSTQYKKEISDFYDAIKKRLEHE